MPDTAPHSVVAAEALHRNPHTPRRPPPAPALSSATSGHDANRSGT